MLHGRADDLHCLIVHVAQTGLQRISRSVRMFAGRASTVWRRMEELLMGFVATHAGAQDGFHHAERKGRGKLSQVQYSWSVL